MSNDTVLRTLTSGFDEVLRDPVWGSIPLSPGLADLASSPVLIALEGIKQLGPASLVYPGATHTRRAHSIGVCHMARRILIALAEKGCVDFIGSTGTASFLAAALCHDIGHFPYAHSLKELSPRPHESLAGEKLLEPAFSSLLGAAGADPAMTAAIIDEDLPDDTDREIRFFRSLLSGVLDPDKLDYLNRDAFFCGVPYGIQDTDFILRRMMVDSEDRPGVDARGIMSIEGLLFSKYLMYRAVYWHRDVRSATAMVKKDVACRLRSGSLRLSDLYGLDDAGFCALMAGGSMDKARDTDGYGLASMALRGRLFSEILELPFDPRDSFHASLLDLGRRSEVEQALERQLAVPSGSCVPDGIVIDIPEALSFESAMPVIGEDGDVLPFVDCATVFAGPVIEGFTRSLRTLRVFVSPGLIERLGIAAVRETLRSFFASQPQT